ncbi:hypothetical protein OHS81_18700 [Streptomyces sp. NBC_00400]|uniref:hypothetical protein n=1 Tax=Streptomyces sp. NBC_00400 TaxID=2975737 RepID=UPI002E227E91
MCSAALTHEREAKEAEAGAAAQGRVSAAPRRAGAWFAVPGLAAIVPVLPLWLFSSLPDLRQKAILVALGCALGCLVAIALYQRTAGGRRPFHTVAVAEFSGAAEADVASASGPAAIPRELPSRRGMQWRALGGYAGGFTVLVTLIALAGGAPQRTELMHGMLKSRDAKLLSDEGVPVEKAQAGTAHVEKTADVETADVETAGSEKAVPEKAAAEAQATRTLRLWDPRSAWPLFMRPSALTLAALLVACGALLTCDITVVWRWTTAIAGVVVGIALAILSTIHEPLRPPEENAR